MHERKQFVLMCVATEIVGVNPLQITISSNDDLILFSINVYVKVAHYNRIVFLIGKRF